MKRVLLLTAATVALAAASAMSPAMASSYGTDSESFSVSGTAQPFCQFGSPTVGSSTNASGTVSGKTGSVSITNLQQAGTDVEQAWSLTIDNNNSVCNYHFDVSATSTNGGLKYQGSEDTTDPSFTKLLNYNVASHFAPGQWNDRDVNVASAGTPFKVAGWGGGIQPTAGNFQFTLRSPYNNLDTHNLLNGAYSDTIVVSIGPTA